MIDARLHAARCRADPARIGRNAAPSDDTLPFLPNDHREERSSERGTFLLGRTEERPDRVTSRLREIDPVGRAVGAGDSTELVLAREERMRNLEEDPGPIAAARIGAGWRTRCTSIRSSAPRPFSTINREGVRFRSAMNPTPHASCSKVES